MFIHFTGNGQNNNLILKTEFEDQSYLNDWNKEVCCDYSIQINNQYARKGKSSAQFTLNRTDPVVAKGKRSELRQKPQTDPLRWFAFSIYLDKNYNPDIEPEILAQWHDVPDKELGETPRIPPVALSTKNGRWNLTLVWAKAALSDNSTKDGLKDFDLGEITKEAWTDWVFRINFSYQDSANIQIWKNDVPVLNYTGPNCYNDQILPYFKIGIYKWKWKEENSHSLFTQRIVYFDEVRIGNESASYSDLRISK